MRGLAEALDFLPPGVGWAVTGVIVAAAVFAAFHALLSKRDSRSALGWVAVCLLFPLAGPALYYVFGVNRIRTRAKRLHAEEGEEVPPPEAGVPTSLSEVDYTVARVPIIGEAPETELADLVRLSQIVTRAPLSAGNSLRPLHNGEQAYPEMLQAIAAARHTVYLSTYIFEANASGLKFVDALAAAVARGVAVRVLVDGVGELYGGRRISRILRRAGVPHARFLPPRLFPPQLAINLRTHRKILAVDGHTAFTGGMNIGDRHLVDRDDPDRVVDLHFAITGPVVREIEEVFREDWAFAAGEKLPAAPPASDVDTTRARRTVPGNAYARVIIDGPNEDLDKLATILIGAVACARRRVWLVTPYFLPPRELLAALRSAALRGVDVRVVLPGHNNLPYVDWASRNVLRDLLPWGVEVTYQRGPFAHTKLVLVDDVYVQLGSANIDPRSLRLNFELTVEVYDRGLATELRSHVQRLIESGRRLSIEELRARPWWQRVRDALAWLASPYL